MTTFLTPTVVDNRPGYVNGQGQTFAVPKSAKRVESWRKKMEAKGYTFGG